eukprot:1179561-Prorocentrum_minimum.AAC.1
MDDLELEGARFRFFVLTPFGLSGVHLICNHNVGRGPPERKTNRTGYVQDPYRIRFRTGYGSVSVQDTVPYPTHICE